MAEMKIIARIRTPFKTKFGIPRQSGVAAEVKGEIVFEPDYRETEAVRGLEGFSHIWLIWCFTEAVSDKWSPTVRPPRLGGNVRMGVFATRSPFRPNPIGLSSVKLERVEYTADRGPVLHVRGADLMDGTPIFDIKPYVAYADSHPAASGGFTDTAEFKKLRVELDDGVTEPLPEGLFEVLENDPRPRYHDDPERVYGMEYGGREVKFRVRGDILTVIEIR
ncbi:MAG: tRNA (N6-threonylcarbamoyladenosine(37)-N6)-methyltransferase TrmO [Oscillospiraceae bacterium]|nr:tRNA (N6-threonylcarbamoyladenosine(37)-N6)-methyltransferase TrmO [Oscillospiraceae bacterium]